MGDPVVIGLTVYVPVQVHDIPVLKERVEKEVGEHFENKYGFAPTAERTWLYDEGGEFEDPDEEGEMLILAPRWVLLVEGVDPHA